MIKFEDPTEKESTLEVGKSFTDKNNNKHVLLESDIHCIFPSELDNYNYLISGKLAELVKEEKIYVCNNVLDYCPGHGSIGLDFLSLGTTNRVTFADTNEISVTNCLKTAQENSLLFYTTGYVLDSINDIPEDEKFDIIIATIDDDNKYKDFFAYIYKYMTIYADIYLVEDRKSMLLKNPKLYELSNIYYVKSFPLAPKTIMHYKLSHDHLK